MGKRKERRIAAGRRVKLDLFAEPSGDLGGSSTKDEAGGEDDSKNRAGLPNSPSSSGQRSENPLLLLGQYSDDELDEESGQGLSCSIVENSSAELDDQLKVASGEVCEDTGVNKGGELSAQKVEQENMEHSSSSLDGLHKEEENGTRESDAADSGDLHGEMDMGEQISAPEISDVQTTVDVNSAWKMVLHEETNTYYYWNIVTGETSWEVPDVLAQGTESALEPKTAPEAEGRHDAFVDTHKSSATLDVEMDDAAAAQRNNGSVAPPLICEAKGIDDIRPDLEVQNEGYTGDEQDDKENGNHVNHSDMGKISCQVSAHHGISLPGGLASSRQSDDALLNNGDTRCADSSIQDMGDHVQQETMSDLSSHLMRFGESLLGRLKSLRGSGCCEDQILKFMLGVEIRLYDMRSLISHGSSLLPFWLHSENQLKQLEAAIDDEVLKHCESATIIEIEAARKFAESIHDGIKADTDEKNAACSTSPDSDASDQAISKEVEKDSSNNPAVHAGNVSSVGYPYSHSDSDAGGMVESRAAVPAEAISKTGNISDEDMDMDVEMEVEDAIPANDTCIGDVSGAQYGAPPVQPLPPNPPSQHESLALDEGVGVPPPPDDGWIPPPPPDDEPFPPPPPEASYPPPPSEFQTVQPYSYAEQYSFMYPASSFEYYGQTNTEIPSSGYYVDANGNQVAASLPPLYYAAVPSTYADVASVVVNSIEPVSYYTLEEGSVPTAPGTDGIETSGLHRVSVPGSFVSDQTGSVEAQNEVGFTPLSTTVTDVSAVGREIAEASIEVPSIPASTQAQTTIPVTRGFPVVSAPAVAATVALTETIPKVQHKAARSKKRTVAVVSTLRSNKKVSGLVDKWKAAKEELHDNEENEPENAYEALEKKRQREIEQWRAQQIATGEAKDNANFQPLGCDWRERVKRKRAKKMRETEEAPSESINDVNQQPDLNDVSKGLPSGWQAYWDETSKQVYYGNSATSETTWIRPMH